MGTPAKLGDLETVFGSFIRASLGIIAIIAIIMLIVGGYSYLMAGADKEGVGRAKNTLTFAIIGLVLAISAWMILNLTERFLGLTPGTLTNFSICLPGFTGPDCT